MISLHLSELASSVGPKIGPSVLLAMASGLAVVDAPFSGSMLLVVAALAGSSSAELCKFLNSKEPSLSRFWKEAFKTAGIVLLGFLFGCFVGPSFANMTGATRATGGFLMGLGGYAIMRVILSPDFILKLAQKIVEGARDE